MAAAGSGSGDGSGRGPGSIWSDSWREGYAKGDQGRLNVLNRYTDPSAMLDAHFALLGRMQSGELKSQLKADATPEQVTAWRKENGIPEKPESYLENLPPEIKLDAEDRAVLTPFAQAMHKHNLSPAAAAELVQVRAKLLDDMVDARIAKDTEVAARVTEQLRGNWGRDYQGNMNAIANLLAAAPPDVKLAVQQSRTPNGDGLTSNVAVMGWLASLARQLGMQPATIFGLNGAPLEGQQITQRKSEIEAWMRAPNGSSDYKRYWSDAAVQKEYHQILQLEEQQRARLGRTAAA